ncbi:hypothetical protein ACS3SW_05810 [Roseobacteraceae bacterium S113]
MLLERTIFQLDIGHMPPEQARARAHLGYMQWLGALPGEASFVAEARHAYATALPHAPGSPAIAQFCALLAAALAAPLEPLVLELPAQGRRGGAQARRMSL